MDLALSEDQQLLKETARKFLRKECPRTFVRELLATPEGYSPKLWRKMAEMGWLSLPFPETYDGTAASFLDLGVLLEEMGRALLPGPFFSTMLLGGYPILDAGSAAQKAALLPRIAAGDLILTFAFLETGAAYDPCAVNLVARPDGDAYVLDGVKLFVPNAHVADLVLTVARTSPGGDKHGLTIFLVDGHDPDLHCTLLQPIDHAKLCEVAFDGLRVPRENVLGEVDGAWTTIERALARAAIGECLQLIGGMQVVLDMSVEHVKNRVQFGQPVGAFQAVQHHCANMLVDLDGARLLAYEAACAVSEGSPTEKLVAMAKAWVGEACHRIMSHAHQVHGGTGFIDEHDLTLYFRRTVAAEVAYGGADFHYRALAQTLEL
ncbi:MAG: acyl-CoA dehydrogenase [Chloroflexota bacterium]|nr:MAG: acyl-CoA dehydrogenase [Chloroflexota bacterium]